ncbi:hypothetical protein ACLMJK_008476 [Lecanora helva]
MPLRPARSNDLPIISKVYAAVFYDDDMMGALMHPYRQSHPGDYQKYWENKVREWYWDYSHQLIVTYMLKETDEKKEEVVTGVGDWIRYGKGWERYWGVWGKWDPRNLIRKLILLRHYISSFLHPNRAADPEMHKKVSSVFSYTKHLWSGRRDTGWYLNFLAVDPRYQSQGHGRLLASWGVERADEEKVAASVISGTDKDRFYQRCGFGTKGGHVSDGEGNPLKDLTEGGSVLFHDPKFE